MERLKHVKCLIRGILPDMGNDGGEPAGCETP